MARGCSIAGCTHRHYGRGLCRSHYMRQRRNGTPTAGGASAHEPLVGRVMRGLPVDRHPATCWEWTRGRSTAGYGVVTLPGGGSMHAHRAAYLVFVGALADGLEPDHLCRNKACVNPLHLEAVTRAENVRRGWPFRREAALAHS